MATKIILKKSSVAGKIPDAVNLEVGEPAVNLADSKLYTKDSNNKVIEIAKRYDALKYYIDPDNGDDTNEGTSPTAMLKTIDEATSRVNDLFSNNPGVEVSKLSFYLTPGTHNITVSSSNWRADSIAYLGKNGEKDNTHLTFESNLELHIVTLLYFDELTIDAPVVSGSVVTYLFGGFIRTLMLDEVVFNQNYSSGHYLFNICYSFLSLDVALSKTTINNQAHFINNNFEGQVNLSTYMSTIALKDNAIDIIKKPLTNSIGVVTNLKLIGDVTLTDTDRLPVDKGYVDTLTSAYQLLSEKGQADGYAELDSNGAVPTSQLPSYVDDVLEYADFASLPATGETGKIYVTTDDNKTFRWSGTQYVEISSSLALGETDSTAYRGDRGKIAYDHSQITTGNPHGSITDDINEGSTNLYWTQTRFDSAFGLKVIDDLNDIDTTTTAPVNNDILRWNGTNWIPSADSDTTYTAGSGITLSGTEFSLSDESYTSTEKNKLSNIEDGAEVNTQSDWNETNNTEDSFILNKPDDITDLSSHNIDELGDVDTTTTTPSDGSLLKFDGTNWVVFDSDTEVFGERGTITVAGYNLVLDNTAIPSTLRVYRNGLRLALTDDYTYDETQKLVSLTEKMVATDVIQLDYKY